ncbi:NAD(P)/FAD-dependent oxidoreductase [Allohahella marinimesophila]|uniref:NAD(P)/FAD-dependent oxidoreductase n=1 Tax=Allohahella marinimesophila TaxID=1054972 RepID=A0ABP7Q5F6_9GAMM
MGSTGRQAVYDAIIVGAGFGGIGMAITLRRKGIRRVLILERGAQIGGCWAVNTYPGAACDVPSHLYSYSFAPMADWSRKFAPQPEILAYIQDCAKQFGVEGQVRLRQSVTSARFDSQRARWTITTAAGEALEAKVFIPSTGQLSEPMWPRLEGEPFEGLTMHSAHWDHQHDLQGRRVAVIGTGASAIQFVPRIAGMVADLHVIQRSAPYVIDKRDGDYSPLQRKLFATVPGLLKAHRLALFLQHEARFVAFARPGSFMKLFERQARQKRLNELKAKPLAVSMTPDYPMGCKRILISNDYYEAFNRPNVHLHHGVSVRTCAEGLEVEDASGSRLLDVDTLIFGTGFAATDFLSTIDISGADGISLKSAWAESASAYLGISVSGFPNMFIVYGPNTNLGHNSIISMLEAQFGYIAQAVELVVDGRVDQLDLKADVQSSFDRDLQNKLQKTVWGAGCDSWYKTASGRISTNWYGLVSSYRRLARHFDLQNYHQS